MLVDPAGKNITNHDQYASVSLLRPSFDDKGRLLITHPEKLGQAVEVNLGGEKAETDVRIGRKGEYFKAHDLGDDLAAQMTDLAGFECRVVRSIPDYQRAGQIYGRDDVLLGAFGDKAPLHIINKASVEALSQKTGFEINIDAFRADIILSGLKPFAEDYIESICVNGAKILIADPTVRCQTVTRDPKTSQTYGNNAVMSALREFKRMARGTVPTTGLSFGVYAVPEDSVDIQTDAIAEVVWRDDPHPALVQQLSR